jgi:ABC-2 type transport system ATP-binding protein
MATIEVTGLRKRFGRTQALDGMTFTVAPGEVTGFAGPNGAGKPVTGLWRSLLVWKQPVRA